MKAEVLEEVKKDVQKMLDAGFIMPCRYAEWISSVVPVQKKDGRWRVCVDFRDLNRATPKDEYPMPVDAPSRPNLCTASARIVVAFPLEYSPKVYQSVDRQRTT